MHDKRHREIASVLIAIRRFDESPVPLFNKKRKGKKKNDFRMDLTDLEAELNEIQEDQQDTAWDNQSSTLNDEDVQERVDAMDDPSVRKTAKAERKSIKNQVRFDVITKMDLDKIQDALHPELRLALEEAIQGQGLFDNSTIDQNIAFSPHTFKYSSLRKGVHEKRMQKNNRPHKKGDACDAEDILEPVLKALGVKTRLAKAPRERKNLEAKLRNAIMSDITAFENEQAETMERMAGYWRYVNKRTYNQMVENNELWDWATGQKLLKVDETEMDTIEEEDESVEGETLNGSTPNTTPVTSPECWDDDKDFELPTNGLTFGRKPFPKDADGLKTPTQATFTIYSEDPELHAQRAKDLSEESHLTTLSFDPGRSPGPTMTFRVPSPSSSDDDPFERYWDGCNTPIRKESITSQAKEPSKSALSPLTPNVTARPFDGKKDTRTCSKIAYVREASPPRDEPSVWLNPSPKAPSPSTIPPTSADVNNHFGNLEREIPAPSDDAMEAATPTKAKIITIAVPLKVLMPEAEEGWEIQAGPKKNNRNFPKLGDAKKKGGSGLVLRQGKSGPSYANVAAGKKR